jgi:hypothetical protein
MSQYVPTKGLTPPADGACPVLSARIICRPALPGGPPDNRAAAYRASGASQESGPCSCSGVVVGSGRGPLCAAPPGRRHCRRPARCRVRRSGHRSRGPAAPCRRCAGVVRDRRRSTRAPTVSSRFGVGSRPSTRPRRSDRHGRRAARLRRAGRSCRGGRANSVHASSGAFGQARARHLLRRRGAGSRWAAAAGRRLALASVSPEESRGP